MSQSYKEQEGLGNMMVHDFPVAKEYSYLATLMLMKLRAIKNSYRLSSDDAAAQYLIICHEYCASF